MPGKCKDIITTKCKCLICATPFDSEGIHNRICSKCKTTESWKYGDGNMTRCFSIPSRKARSE
jgi:hypothetical protein